MPNSIRDKIGVGLFILAPVMVLEALAMDIFVTCVVDLRKDFNASQVMVQWVLSAFMMSQGLSQILAGPLTDKFGRRSTMLIFIIFFMVSSLLCALSSSMQMLIMGRVLQGVGACGIHVATYAIVRDSYNEHNRSKMYSYINSCMAVAPMVAPSFGAYLVAMFHSWTSTFYFLALFSSLTVISVYKLLPETKPANTIKVKFLDSFKNYLIVARNPQFCTYLFCATTALTSLFAFFSISALLVIDKLHLSRELYALMFSSGSVVFLIFSFLSPRFEARLGIKNTVLLGSILVFIGSIIMLVMNIGNALALINIFGPNYIIVAGVGLIFGPCSAGALKAFSHMAGIASALYGTIEYFGAGLFGTLVMVPQIMSAAPFAVCMISLSLINILLLIFYID